MKARMLFTGLAFLILAMSQGCAVYRAANNVVHEVVGFAYGDGSGAIVLVDGISTGFARISGEYITFTVLPPQLGNPMGSDVVPDYCAWSWAEHTGSFTFKQGDYTKNYGLVKRTNYRYEGPLTVTVHYKQRIVEIDHLGNRYEKWFPYPETVTDASVTIRCSGL